MTGIVPIHKPNGMTSRSVTSFVKRLARGEKCGHLGTLDPLASGVLPILVGRATQLNELLLSDKAYVAVMKLGIKTDTGDVTGQVTERRKVPDHVDEKDLTLILDHFRGDIMQTPPMYSALKQNGVPLYKLARRGETVHRDARKVRIHDIVCLSVSGDEVCIEVRCSSGTYIRTLCEDIGERLGCGAAMQSLVRTCEAGISLADCITMEDITHIRDCLIRPETLLTSYPPVSIPQNGQRYYQNGGALEQGRIGAVLENDHIYRVYSETGVFLGLGQALQSHCGLLLKAIWQNETNEAENVQKPV